MYNTAVNHYTLHCIAHIAPFTTLQFKQGQFCPMTGVFTNAPSVEGVVLLNPACGMRWYSSSYTKVTLIKYMALLSSSNLIK